MLTCSTTSIALPVRQRFTIIINELGAGLAGRGSDINVVVKRADPALREFDKVLAILAGENKLLAKLSLDSDQALAPFAAVRERVADYIVQQNTVATATARHNKELAENFADFPAFLRQFGPAMERVGKFADETTPTFTDLKAAAPGINGIFTNLVPFQKSSTKFFVSLGKTAQVSGPAIAATKPLLERVQKLGGAAKPFAGNFSELLTSLRNTGGLERLLDLIFLGGGSLNGYDSLGHFVRAEILGKNCVGYKVTPQSGCSANFVKGAESSSLRKPGLRERRRQLHQPRDGPHARGSERRHPGAGDREVPRSGADALRKRWRALERGL